LNSRIM